MKTCAWLTDIHLNFVDSDVVAALGRAAASSADCLVITGDISEAPHLRRHLIELQAAAKKPIYFVLGNHDFYKSSVSIVRGEMHELTKISNGALNWMPITGVVSLTQDTALIGHDGWYDALCGDWQGSQFVMADWHHIEEFKRYFLQKIDIISFARQLSATAAREMEINLQKALETHKNVLALTHVPPYEGASKHKGRANEPYAAPWYVSVLMGEMFTEVMRDHPDKTLTILAGHTHSFGRFRPIQNIECIVGSAEYGEPAIASLLQIK